MVVPGGHPAGLRDNSRPPSMTSLVPPVCSGGLVTISSLLTEAMLGSASPRKPRELIFSMSDRLFILLVACL